MVLSASLANVQGLVQQGSLAQAATTLGHYSHVVSGIDWLATTATVIAGLDHEESVRQHALSQLLASEPVTRLFHSDDRAVFSASVRSMTFDHLRSHEAAVAHLIGSFPDWDERVVQLSLASVIQAGGLGDLVLQLERRYGDFTAEQSAQAREELQRTRVNFSSEFKEFRHFSIAEKQAAVRGKCTIPLEHKEIIDDKCRSVNFVHTLLDLAFIRAYLDRTYPMHELYAQGDRPRLFSNYLRSIQDSDDYGNGSCMPATTLAADLGLRAGFDFKFLHHVGHVNLYHAPSHVVFEPAPGVNDTINLLSRFQRGGAYGRTQTPTPLAALLVGVAGNVLVAERREADLDGAERLFAGLEKLGAPSSAFYLQKVEIALLRQDPVAAEQAMRKGLAVNATDYRLVARGFDIMALRDSEQALKRGEAILCQLTGMRQRMRATFGEGQLTQIDRWARSLRRRIGDTRERIRTQQRAGDRED